MLKYTKAEAGKLGGAASKVTCALNKEKRIEEYNKVAKKCKCCQTELSYEHRNKIFCNSSCAAKFNNLERNARTTPTSWVCLNCEKVYETRGWKVGKYCNNVCQKEFEYKKAIENWHNVTPGNSRIKRFLAEKYGSQCSVCGIKEWNHKPIVFELEHKDGNSENNQEENLCLICPNCHSQTATYKNKNKGHGRHARRQRYAVGKSF